MTGKRTFGETLQALILDHPGRIRELAQDLGLAENTVYNALNPHDARQLTLQAFLHIVRRYRGRDVLAALAADIDCMVLPIPAGTSTTPDLFRHVAKVSRECGEAVGAMADALADGKLSAKEREKAQAEVHDAMVALGGLYHALVGKAGA